MRAQDVGPASYSQYAVCPVALPMPRHLVAVSLKIDHRSRPVSGAGNATFDAKLRSTNSTWGIRDVDELSSIAAGKRSDSKLGLPLPLPLLLLLLLLLLLPLLLPFLLPLAFAAVSPCTHL